MDETGNPEEVIDEGGGNPEEGGGGGGGGVSAAHGGDTAASRAEVIEDMARYGWRRDGSYGPLGGSHNSTDNALLAACVARGDDLEYYSMGTGADYRTNSYTAGAAEWVQESYPNYLLQLNPYEFQKVPKGGDPHAGKG